MASEYDYPIYIISKGRAYNPMTALNFEKSKINYLIAVEPQEKEEYIKDLKLGMTTPYPPYEKIFEQYGNDAQINANIIQIENPK